MWLVAFALLAMFSMNFTLVTSGVCLSACLSVCLSACPSVRLYDLVDFSKTMCSCCINLLSYSGHYLLEKNLYMKNKIHLYKDPPSSLQISVKIRYQGTKPNGHLRRSTGIAIHCEYQPNQISEPWNQGSI